jgi:hypothetical protein
LLEVTALLKNYHKLTSICQSKLQSQVICVHLFFRISNRRGTEEEWNWKSRRGRTRGRPRLVLRFASPPAPLRCSAALLASACTAGLLRRRRLPPPPPNWGLADWAVLLTCCANRSKGLRGGRMGVVEAQYTVSFSIFLTHTCNTLCI